jgi:soluble lytic murein transglycosylase-like protein
MPSNRQRAAQVVGAAIIATSVMFLGTINAQASPLDGTDFQTVADEFSLDPLLLYSVALAESARSNGSGQIGPWPWTLRVPAKGYYLESEQEAEALLAKLLESHGSVDIGMMQVSVRWNGHRVESPAELLDPAIALRTGAEILREALDSAPGDLQLGIGRYHTWKNEAAARNYGDRVLAFRRNIANALSAGTVGGQ